MLWLTETGGPVYYLKLWWRAWLIPGRDLQRWLQIVSLHQMFSCKCSSLRCVMTQEDLWMCLMSAFLNPTLHQIQTVLQVCAGPDHLQAESLLSSSIQEGNQRSCSTAAVSVSTWCLNHLTTCHCSAGKKQHRPAPKHTVFWSAPCCVLVCFLPAAELRSAALTGSMLTQTSARFWFFIHDFSLMSAFVPTGLLYNRCQFMHQVCHWILMFLISEVWTKKQCHVMLTYKYKTFYLE